MTTPPHDAHENSLELDTNSLEPVMDSLEPTMNSLELHNNSLEPIMNSPEPVPSATQHSRARQRQTHRSPPNTLPPKYYLQHFHELLQQLSQHSSHLFSATIQKYLAQFQSLSEAAQCLYLRITSRKSYLVKLSTLKYEEIGAIDAPLQQLQNLNWVAFADAEDESALLQQLTKPELKALLKDKGVRLTSNQLKADYLAAAQQLAQHQELGINQQKQWLKHQRQGELGYLLFLYFGRVEQQLNQFSLRDLGLRRTRKNQKEGAYFLTLEEAESCYAWGQCQHQLKALDGKKSSLSIAGSDIKALINQMQQPPKPQGQQAELHASECYWYAGKALLKHPEYWQQAMAFLRQSQLPKAQEKWLRETYHAGDKEQVKAELENLIATPNDPELMLFAKDFYQRKFAGQRLSTLTDWLRNHSDSLTLDPAHKGAVEQGVKHHYQRRDIDAVAAENRPWRGLFALTFWDLIFHVASRPQANEFDRVPRVIRENSLYRELGPQVDQQLASFANAEQWRKHLIQMATQHYGKSNGMFRWYPGLLQHLDTMLTGVDLNALKQHMQAMTENYQGLNDGYPDLMLKDESGVYFTEVKGPGDQIRRNQALTLQKLQQANIRQRLTRVSWGYDAQQPFAVIDVETTGGSTPENRVTEVGIVKVVADNIVARWSSLINPQRPIPASITRLTGISNAMVATAPTFAEVIDEIATQLQGCIFVAHNVAFDAYFMQHEFNLQQRRFRYPLLCTRDESKRLYPGLSGYGLAKLCQHFDIALHNHHRALADAEAAAELLIMRNQHLAEHGV